MAFYGPILGMNPTRGTSGDVVEVSIPPRHTSVFNLRSGVPMRVVFSPSRTGAPGTVIGGLAFQAQWTVTGPNTLRVVVPAVGNGDPVVEMPPGDYVINLAQGFDRAHTASVFSATVPGTSAAIAWPGSPFVAFVVRFFASILFFIRTWLRVPIWAAPPPPPPPGTTFSTYNIETDQTFIANVLKDTAFKNDGYLYGDQGVYWAVVDPVRHPLYVWKKPGLSYNDGARSFDATVVTNGPLMAPIFSTALALPWGPLHGARFSVDDAGDPNNVHAEMFKFGRRTPTGGKIAFSDYVMAQDHDITGFDEVITMLYPIMSNNQPFSQNEADANFNASFKLFITGSTAARFLFWALVPLEIPSGGVIVVAASPSAAIDKRQAIVDALVRMRARDAVAVDGSSSTLIGERQTLWVECQAARMAIMKFGFCCLPPP